MTDIIEATQYESALSTILKAAVGEEKYSLLENVYEEAITNSKPSVLKAITAQYTAEEVDKSLEFFSFYGRVVGEVAQHIISIVEKAIEEAQEQEGDEDE